MCAFAVLKLGDLVEEKGSPGKIIELEPQGAIFIAV